MNKIFFALLSACCLMIGNVVNGQTYDERVEQYIAQYKAIAIEEMQRTHIPASITLAQGIIESSAGQSPLATKANNHFGIKCHEDWTGKVFYYDDDKKHECFRKYKTAAESFKDHSDFLTGRSRYSSLFTYDLCDYCSWANGLKACGYATNPQYANVLIKCIENYDLHQWDLNDEERTQWFAQINKTDTDLKKTQGDQVMKVEASDPLLQGGKTEDRIYVFNNIKCVTLLTGETLNDLATKFEIGINRLMRYNDVTDQLQIVAGDRVYLQPKRNKGDENFHTVQIGESMFSISRDHGIQLQELYEKNLLKEGDQPLQGEVIYLREKRLAPPKIQDTIDHDQMELVNTPVAENSPDQIHVVSKGDTLYSVAKKYNMTIDELKQINHLYSENLYVGERLKVVK